MSRDLGVDYFRWETSDSDEMLGVLTDWHARLKAAGVEIISVRVNVGDQPIGSAEVWFRLDRAQAEALGYTADEVAALEQRSAGAK